MADLSIYIAKIEVPATKEDNRLQVRVLPHMENLPLEMLPVWPCFFKYQYISGKPGELVWCIANSEFTMGYVLGYANTYSWVGDYTEDSLSDDFKNKLDDFHVELRGTLLNFSDMIVTFWNETSIHFVSRSSGDHIIAFTSGTLHIVRPKEVITSVEGESIFKVTKDEIVLSAKKIRLAGEVRLGTNPQGSVLVTQGVLGKNGVPAKDVWA